MANKKQDRATVSNQLSELQAFADNYADVTIDDVLEAKKQVGNRRDKLEIYMQEQRKTRKPRK